MNQYKEFELLTSQVNFCDFISRVFYLARPFGVKRMAIVFALSLAQGLFQVVGVTSVFPFLAVAADPDRLRESSAGGNLLELLPSMSDDQLLIFTGLCAIGTLLVSNGINLFAEVIRARYARGFAHWLRVGLLQNIVRRPYADFLQQNTGVLLKKVNGDVTNYTSGVLLPLLDSVSRVITIALLLTTLVVINPLIAMSAVILFGTFYLFAFKLLTKRRNELAEGMKITNRGIMQESQQLLGGIKPIKVHCSEEVFLGSLSRFSHQQSHLMSRMPLYSNGPRYLIEPLAFGGLVVVVLIYAAHGQDFAAILPTLGVMALAGYRLLPALQMLYGQMTLLSTTRHALDEVYDEFLALEQTLDKEPADRLGRFSTPDALEWKRDIVLEDVSYRYPSSPRPIISHLNLRIAKNSSTGIIGPTGTGKSTLIDIILGLLVPTEGEILIDGVPLTSDNRRAWRAGIGYVPQELFLCDDSIAANIAFGVPADRIDHQRLYDAAKAAHILNFIENELPEKWETVVGERGIRLSGGQRQRIGLARALYHRPSLLILDEATSALDLETEANVMRAINALRGSVTMLIVAHRLSTIEKCDYQIDLNRPRPNDKERQRSSTQVS